MIDLDVDHEQGGFRLRAAFRSDAGITALFGPSGSGKSTLIGVIAGLVRPRRGRVAIGGTVLVDTAAGIVVPPHRRRIGLVFQDALLFPHLSVRRNLGYGRFFARRAERRIDAEAVIGTLGIGHLLDRRPATLSGGERQRVALARALLAEPRILLMDEPLAALDADRKAEVLPLIERLRDEFGIPIVYVSHAVEEVARLAGTVVMLDHGSVVAVGPPDTVLRPSQGLDGNRFRLASVLTGRLGRADPDYQLTPVLLPSGTIWLSGVIGPEGREVRVVVRGTDVALATAAPRGVTIRTSLQGTITRVTAADGPLATVDVALDGGGGLTAVATRKGLDELGLDRGDRVYALIKTVALDERGLQG